MNDEKIEHLQRLAQRASNSTRRRSKTSPENLHIPPTNSDGGFNFLQVMKKHSGIPFIVSLVKSFNGLTYERYEVLEENTINLLEIFSFVLSYLVPSNSRKKNNVWHRVLQIIDKIILGLRFKILFFKCIKLFKLQRYASQKSSVDVAEKKIVPITLNKVAPAIDTVTNSEAETSSAELIELSGFEKSWSKASPEPDFTALTEYKSTDDQIRGLRTEVFVELVDFLFLLYPRSITEVVYEKLFGKKNE